MPDRGLELIAIGTSAGGIEAVQTLLGALPADWKTPIAIVQHLPQDPRVSLAHVFARGCQLPVLEVEDKMPIFPGEVYVAPAGYHLLVERDREFSLNQDELVHFSRPSIDVFFESVARALGARAIGVLLTGANADGASGLEWIQKLGGVAIVQDPVDAQVPMMPQAALDRFAPNHVTKLKDLFELLSRLTGEGVKDEQNQDSHR